MSAALQSENETPQRTLAAVATVEAAESLAQLVKRTHEQTQLQDPRELASAVLSAIADADLRAMLAVALPEYVRQVVKGDRNRATSGAPAPSAKVAAVRDWHARLMASPVDVAGDGSQWKALAQCTRDDLLNVARHRRDTAARNLAIADRYESLAKVLPVGKTVGELPQEAVHGVFGRTAP